MFKVNGFPSAFVLGVIVGVVYAFFRKGSSTGDGKPFSGG